MSDNLIDAALEILSELEDHAYYTLNDGYTVRRVRELTALLEHLVPSEE